jgi:hypothetical protein
LKVDNLLNEPVRRANALAEFAATGKELKDEAAQAGPCHVARQQLGKN